MSIHAQALLAQARQQFSAFKGAAERGLIREKGKCAREHCSWAAARLNETIRQQPRAVAAALALFPASKPTAARAQQQQKPAPRPVQGGMPALTPEQRRTFKR